MIEPRDRWARSGAMALTGRADGPPLVAPDAVVERIRALAGPLDVDPLSLLAERAALTGLSRRGRESCGGAARLIAAADAWVVASLPRLDDVDLVPAWLGLDAATVRDDLWRQVETTVGRMEADEVVSRGVLLGLPVAVVPRHRRDVDHVAFDGLPLMAHRVADSGALGRPPLVVDLSSLWAGPLCARLLGERGARIVKVESTHRPDGARRGPSGVYDRLHAGHESVALDLLGDEGRRRLRELVMHADVVIEASRPRALAQLGVDPIVAIDGGPHVWVSITGYGREVADGMRVAFGDDAAAAGGLVAWERDEPSFVADAVADPLTGVAAAAAVTRALESGGRWVLDVAMSDVAAHIAGPPTGWVSGEPGEAVEPSAETPMSRAPELGVDTDSVLAELGIR